MTSARQTLCVISPCFNEEQSVEPFYAELCRSLAGLDGLAVHMIFVDDGSADRTLERLRAIAARDSRVEVVSLSRNFGHQAALSAGLDAAVGDAVVMLDSDLQHPPALIGDMVARWREGFDVVSALRKTASGEGWTKRMTSRAFYWLMNRLSDTEIVPDAADFVLLSAAAFEALRAMPERHRFLRGLVSWIGFRRGFVHYDVSARAGGTTKYTWGRMIRFALDAVFSFTTAPIRLASRVGALIAVAGLIYLAFVLEHYWWRGDLVEGWGSMMSVLLIIGGAQLVFIGLIGEYLARTYEESKHRPLYIVRERIGAAAPRDAGRAEL